MVLHDAGHLEFEEPYAKFRAHGTIVRDGAKMSKSRGNVVIPDEYIERWGADTFRTYLMFLGPYEEGGDFQDRSIAGVRRFLDRFQTGDRRAVVERWLVRAGRYLPMVLDVFKQKGLPEDLVFTAMIESGFDPLAASRAGARGIWQFMAPTARRYGLRVDRWLDERLDPEKSTAAAAIALFECVRRTNARASQ